MSVQAKWIGLVFVIIVALCCSLIGVTYLAHADTKYVVHKGDNLWHIAQTHDTSVNDMMHTNHLASDMLHIHQILDVPNRPITTHHHPPTVFHAGTRTNPKAPTASFTVIHTVEPGDTLWRLATVNHTTVTYLVTINQLDSNIIYPGEKLRVYMGNRAAYQRALRQQYVKVGLPVHLVPVYQAAGKRYGIPWTVLAAIHRVETQFATGCVISTAGAQGPMQFMPATFRAYAVRAPGQSGAPDINNVDDAIYTCAHMLRAEGYRTNPVAAIYAYNHSFTYVDNVLAFARHFEV
jgi:LysM repeat protein